MVMGELPVETDVLVVGGGPGGYAAAFRAADLGLNVTLVCDEPRLGGVCLLRGCIPSKTLLSLAELVLTTREAAAKGLSFEAPSVDLEAMRTWKDEVVEQLTDGLDHLCNERGIQRLQARATFEGTDQVHLDGAGETQALRFEHAIIATGSQPVPLPGTDFGADSRVMDSAAALALDDVPTSLLVVGGGYVGLELGTVYAALGSQVTLVEMMDRLMPRTDADLVEPLAARVEDLFDAVHLGTEVQDLEETEDGVTVTLGGQEPTEATFDRVLVAIGRAPRTEDIGLDAAGVERDDEGFIVVDEQRRTTTGSIFAVGDATGGMLLAHEAMHEGRVAAEVIAGEPAAFDVRAIPAVVYTDPQVAWCGLTEQDAREQGREVDVQRFPWRAAGRAVSIGATDGMTKLITEPETGRVLGMGIVGRQAEALIAEGVLAIEMGAVARDLALSIHPHPTLSETVGEVAAHTLGQATHLLE